MDREEFYRLIVKCAATAHSVYSLRQNGEPCVHSEIKYAATINAIMAEFDRLKQFEPEVDPLGLDRQERES